MCASLSTCVGVRASCVGGGAAAEKLATLGADLNVRNQLGSTALHYAAMEGHTATCQKLLKLGADLAAVNEAGSSALALAVPLLVCVLCCGWEGGRNLFLKVLVHRGASVDVGVERIFRCTRVFGSVLWNPYAVSTLQVCSLLECLSCLNFK